MYSINHNNMPGEIHEQPANNATMQVQQHNTGQSNDKEWEEKLQAIQKQLDEVPDDNKSELMTIFRLPMWYHETNKHLYEPKMVAIGPYHHGKRSLKAMEEQKLHSLKNFLKDMKVVLKDCFNAVRSLENKARECYNETVRMDGPAFVTMLLFDACFIIDYFKMLTNSKKAITICHVGWANIYLYSDLFMLENQIPFFVIHKLLTLGNNLSEEGCKSPCPLLTLFSAPLKRIFSTEKLSPPVDLSCEEIHHLLHFYYKSMVLPSKNSQTTDQVDAESCHCWPNPLRWHKLDSNITASSDHEQGNKAAISSEIELGNKAAISSNPEQGNNAASADPEQENKAASPDLEQGNNAASSDDGQGDNISCITELHDAGITFKKKEKPSNMFDISFKNGVMEIPFLKVDDTHNVILWNMVAFEQSQIHTDNSQILSSYLALMDSLINTEKDVAILERHGIIENYLQSNEDAAELFNQFAKSFVLDYSNHHYQHVFKEIKEYSKSRWHKNWARLKHDYFRNIWTTLSVSAATVLLLLTAAQTYFAADQTYFAAKPSH